MYLCIIKIELGDYAETRNRPCISNLNADQNNDSVFTKTYPEKHVISNFSTKLLSPTIL